MDNNNYDDQNVVDVETNNVENEQPRTNNWQMEESREPEYSNFEQPVMNNNRVEQPRLIGFSIAGLVCGVCSIVFFCTYAGLWLGIPGLVLSIIALKNNYAGRGMAIGGLVCSAIGIFISLILICSCIIGCVAEGGRYSRRSLSRYYW